MSLLSALGFVNCRKISRQPDFWTVLLVYLEMQLFSWWHAGLFWKEGRVIPCTHDAQVVVRIKVLLVQWGPFQWVKGASLKKNKKTKKNYKGRQLCGRAKIYFILMNMHSRCKISEAKYKFMTIQSWIKVSFNVVKCFQNYSFLPLWWKIDHWALK